MLPAAALACSAVYQMRLEASTKAPKMRQLSHSPSASTASPLKKITKIVGRLYLQGKGFTAHGRA